MKYKLLGNSGLRVSEICLGTMAFGAEEVWGCDKADSKKIFDSFTRAGGNFLDTANTYAKGAGETILGQLTGPDRDDFVIATKYSLQDSKTGVNHVGNHRKNMMRSVEDSLRRLKTDYIDLLWVHCPDGITPIEEIMRALDDLVRMGKVNYLGISNFTAWEIARANTLAEFKNWTQFVGLQPEYNLLLRDAERELLPMAKALGIAVTPWSPLAGGVLTGKYLQKEGHRVPEDSHRFNEKNTRITRKLITIAEQMGHTPAQVALRWIMQKDQVVIPIVGARKAAQLESSLKCLEFTLGDQEIMELDEISQPRMGYPHDFLKVDMVRKIGFGGWLDEVS